MVMPPTSTARKVTKNLTSDTIVVACKGTSDAMARLNRANSYEFDSEKAREAGGSVAKLVEKVRRRQDPAS